MEAVFSSETSVNSYRITKSYALDDITVNSLPILLILVLDNSWVMAMISVLEEWKTPRVDFAEYSGKALL
jgi:hypothetical protein